jgi:hypothetical protein
MQVQPELLRDKAEETLGRDVWKLMRGRVSFEERFGAALGRAVDRVPGRREEVFFAAMRAATLSLWSDTKWIARFDRDLASALRRTEDPFPGSALRRMPVPCVWVECDGEGAFVCEDGDHVSVWAVMHDRDAVGALRAADAPLSSLTAGVSGSLDERLVHDWLPLALYVSSSEPDVDPSAPKRPGGHGWAAKLVTVSEVGARVGAVLRMTHGSSAGSSAASAPHGRVTPHVRRAHWHSYWTGRGRSERIVKWVPPTLVNAESIDGVSAVVRPVKNS